jgi:hypothetical protein
MLNAEYYIGFKGDTGGLYAKFEKKGFNHCFIFYAISDYQYAVVEHGKMFVQFGTVNFETIEKHLGDDGFVVHVRSKRRPRAKWWWWIPTPDTCVTICKQVLGIHAPFVWSPYQLYKYILKERLWVDQIPSKH